MWYMIAGKSHRMNDFIKFKPLEIGKGNSKMAQVVKVVCCQDQWPKFDPQDPQGWRRRQSVTTRLLHIHCTCIQNKLIKIVISQY